MTDAARYAPDLPPLHRILLIPNVHFLTFFPDIPATPLQSTTSLGTPTPPLNLNYDSSTSSETMNSSSPSPIMKLAPRSCSPGLNYLSDPKTLPSYSPVP